MEPPTSPTPAARRMVSAAMAGASRSPSRDRRRRAGRSLPRWRGRGRAPRRGAPGRRVGEYARGPLRWRWRGPGKPRTARIRAEPASHGWESRKPVLVQGAEAGGLVALTGRHEGSFAGGRLGLYQRGRRSDGADRAGREHAGCSDRDGSPPRRCRRPISVTRGRGRGVAGVLFRYARLHVELARACRRG